MTNSGLDNANIDPIRKDSSRNACARVKIQFANMSRAEVDALVLQFRSNTDLVRQEIGYYDNILILEMTARPNTRFYVQSPEYGQSNEVTLNLEGDTEYEMEARLNSRFSIIVESNVAGAEVYIDGVKKAVTDSSFKATIDDVMVGSHNLKVSYNGVSAAKTIEVKKGSISFVQNVDKSALEPQYVVFEVSPANALVIIDNKQLTLDDGTLSTVKQPGRYEYIVSAKLYHTERGEFTVAGSKVVKHITLQPAFGYLSVGGGALSGAAVFVDDELIGTAPLKSDKLSSGEHSVRLVLNKYKPYTTTVTIRDNQTTNLNPTLSADFATVSLTAPNSATIWVNGTQKGTGSWSGELSTGTYIFEARKEGHRAQKLTKTISATPARQSYTLDAPTPITGSVDINSSPAMADIYLDGKLVGSSPMKINDIIVGSHTLKLSRKGYDDYTKTVTITEGKTTTVTATLTKQSATASATTTTPKPISSSSSGTYNIGDLVTVNGVKGIVFQTSPVVKIVSVAETLAKWSVVDECTYARDKNGKLNMEIIKTIPDWQSKYPAFKWCADFGDGWYLPSLYELKQIYALKETVNEALMANNFKQLGSMDEHGGIWSSSESSDFDLMAFKACFGFSEIFVQDLSKSGTEAVRAVLALEEGTSSQTSLTTSYDIPSIEMVYVAGGSFTMGATREQKADANSDEKPAHKVSLLSYYIGKYEVTQAQWRAVMGSNPSHFTGDNNPVECVSWDKVQEFITRLNAMTGKKFRLPTEAEWEYAARGGYNSQGYKYSGSNNINDVAWYENNSNESTHPVGQKLPNELGIYDMSGNVWELCQDWKAYFSKQWQFDPVGPSHGSYLDPGRVCRGGSWNDNDWNHRVSRRHELSPDKRYTNFGFRLACSPEF